MFIILKALNPTDQPARLKKNVFTCQSKQWLADELIIVLIKTSLLVAKNELAGEASIKSSNTHTSTLAVSYTTTLIPATTWLSINKLFKHFIKAYLKNQNQAQPSILILVEF